MSGLDTCWNWEGPKKGAEEDHPPSDELHQAFKGTPPLPIALMHLLRYSRRCSGRLHSSSRGKPNGALVSIIPQLLAGRGEDGNLTFSF